MTIDTDDLQLQSPKYHATVFFNCNRDAILAMKKEDFLSWVKKGDLCIGKDRLELAYSVKKKVWDYINQFYFKFNPSET